MGQAIALELVNRGASVITVGRTNRDAGNPSIQFVKADLSLLSEAKRVAKELPVESLDMCIFTTGILAAPQREVTSEGLERDLAVSYLSRYVIARDMLQPKNRSLSALHRLESLKDVYPDPAP